jgi:exopolysaccharide production protein ExoY
LSAQGGVSYMHYATLQGLHDTVRFGETLETKKAGRRYLHGRDKYMLDKYGEHVISTLAAPLVRMVQLAIYLEDGSPTIIKMPRVGKNGELFKQYKLRSMLKNSEHETETVRVKPRDDNRITNIGRRIRATSLDELPQLVNINEGNMSLIGPRPKSIHEFSAYSQDDPDFADAYTMHLPGITGLEQVNGRAELSQAERIEATKQYAEEASLSLDLHILKKTITAVRSRRGAY